MTIAQEKSRNCEGIIGENVTSFKSENVTSFKSANVNMNPPTCMIKSKSSEFGGNNFSIEIIETGK